MEKTFHRKSTDLFNFVLKHTRDAMNVMNEENPQYCRCCKKYNECHRWEDLLNKTHGFVNFVIKSENKVIDDFIRYTQINYCTNQMAKMSLFLVIDLRM